MPALVMRAPASSLLDQTYRLVVGAPDELRARSSGVPWGISESAFNARDLDQTYQYSSFGVPGLGLKRGLSEDVVVAPYATALGAMIDPEAAVRNFARLRKAGASGPYGFREALDYTARRLPEGASVAIVRSYMAHHQGMALVALGNVLNDRVMVRPLPRRPDRRGHRAAAPGADAARRARRPAARGGGQERRRCPRARSAGPAPLHVAARRDPADAPPVQRTVRGHGDGRGLRLQPLGRPGRHPLARGRRRATRGAATSSCATCRAGRSGPPATSRAAPRRTATRSTYSEDHAEFIRRDGADHDRA